MEDKSTPEGMLFIRAGGPLQSNRARFRRRLGEYLSNVFSLDATD